MAADPRDGAGQPARDQVTPRTRLIERVAAAVLIVTALAIAGAFAWRQRQDAASVANPVLAVPSVSTTIGAVDDPPSEIIVGTAVQVSGWALDAAGIRGVEIRLDGRRYSARYGIARPDVTKVRLGYPDSAAPGFAFDGDFAPLTAQRHELSVVTINRSGSETVLARKGLVPSAAFEEWQSLYRQRRASRIPPIYILPALSAIGLGGANELDTAYEGYLSPTFRIGMRVPILYLRTTLGAAHDWVFDPDWNIERRCGEKRIAEDSLSATITYAIAHKLPVLFTLNGGIWASAACDAPNWDVSDHLAQEVANCQWNNENQVMPHDYFKRTSGADAPDLARSLTFNVYAAQNRHYKRRNLQSAARLVMQFARDHPELFVGIALDADTYLNPFFDEKQWYDYNPGTLRQFRDWLRGSGPYAGKTAPGAPDLSRYRRKHPLSLAEVRVLSGKPWTNWAEVDPPRSFPREGKPFWQDPWTHEWEVFRRHLVHLHYDDLARWLVEVGVPKSRIYSSQGFIAPYPTAFPFALYIDSPSKNYDTGGMSVEGAIPSDGHLGAIVYGESALNNIRVEGDGNLFATFHQMDPGWAVGEFNTADFRAPKRLPSYAMGYRALREMFNYGARFASPMAWNGSNGIDAGNPGYVSFTAWRNTPLEDAMRDFAIAHAFVPAGTRLWTFGSSRYADTDGWTALAGVSLAAGPGYIDITPHNGEAVIVSPASLALSRGETDLLVLGVDLGAEAAVEIAARTADGAWVTLTSRRGVGELESTSAGLSIPLNWPPSLAVADQIRVSLWFRDEVMPVRVRHVALYPTIDQNSQHHGRKD
jgi:hypothetical protein